MEMISVNFISRKYETLYKKYEKTCDKDTVFYAINNGMIFAYFLNFIKTKFDNNYFECCQEIEEKFGFEVFFYNVKKTSQYKEILNESINIFKEIFVSSTIDGSTLESMLGSVLEKHINQKKTGSYYTPVDTTEYMSQNAILCSIMNTADDQLKSKLYKSFNIVNSLELLNRKILFEDIILIIKNKLNEEEKQKLCNVIYNLKIIDPTCGSGAFIITAYICLESLLINLTEQVDYSALIKTLHGVDISKEAIHLTKLRLLIRIASSNIFVKDFNSIFKNNFIVANSLIGNDNIIIENGFDWNTFGYRFNCIIGNPPYVEAKDYVSKQFLTQKCGNLYAYTIERSCNITDNLGIVSFIVPLSFVSTPRMVLAKEYLENNSANVYYATFADRPGSIFTGVHQRLVIFFAEINNNVNKCNVFSTSYNYWYKEERKDLFKNLNYIKNNFSGILPKLGNIMERDIYSKLINNKESIITTTLEKSEYPIFLSTRSGFWTKAFSSNVFSSKEYKIYYAKTKIEKYILIAILNSSVFYFFWVVSSDCWHITQNNLKDFKFNMSRLSEYDINEIVEKCKLLMKDLEDNKKFIGSKQTDYEYKHKFSKNIIDDIDDILYKIFDLSKLEIEYIKHFTEKYRLNDFGGIK